MPFTFRLERVLSVRRIQEQAARQRHADAFRACEAARGAHLALERAVSRALDELDGLKARDELSAHTLHLHSLYLAGLRRRLHAALEQLRRAEERVEQAAAELLEAHRARQALERLREKEEAVWRRQAARREARSLDEIAAARHRAREEENHGP
ncbi:MAG: hypothetical protein Kow0092_00020 [Deferrisomatales bacterium]